MNILFATAQPHLPQMLGGLQHSSRELALRLKARGHNVAFLCALMPGGYTGIRGRIMIKLSGKKAALDQGQGVPIYRAWFPWEAVDEVAKKMQADVVVVLARQPVKMAKAAQQAGVPLLMMLQDVEKADHGGNFEDLGKIQCVANSQFTADFYKEHYGVSPGVIHPIIDAEKYRTPTTRENVTFINPQPVKGLDIALAAAKACPDIPFSFVEGWPLKPDERRALMKELAQYPNVTFHPPTKNMREIYGKCKILLAPSRWSEAYGRVASEPQFSGIPVIASNRGGLPEAVGPGGILLDPDGPQEAWNEAIRALWENEQRYQELSEAAKKHAARPALIPSHQTDLWEQAIKSAAPQDTKKGSSQ